MKDKKRKNLIIESNVLKYLRKEQKSLTGELKSIQKEAEKSFIPIIPHETVTFLCFFLSQIKPKKILEIGCATGFSSILMAEHLGKTCHVTTIERSSLMIKKAKKNYNRMKLNNRIVLLEGQASEILPTLNGEYDFIFMDSAKSKYIDFLPECLRLLKKNGVLMVDDIFQGGTVLEEDIQKIPRNQRTIHKKLRRFLNIITRHPHLSTSLIPLGDGLALITKKEKIVTI